MFGQKYPANPLSVIAQECHLSGQFVFSGDVLIAGHIHGNIRAQGNVIIEETGCVDGDILCRELKIQGQLTGQAHCQKMNLSEKGIFEGHAFCENIKIHDGGQFLGYRHREPLTSTASES